MTLLDVLKLISKDFFPPVMEVDKRNIDIIDTRPQSTFNVTICFMCEEETWLTCNIQNEILIPWYDCEVSSIQPDTTNENALCVWLKDKEYIKNKFSHCVEIIETDKPEEG